MKYLMTVMLALTTFIVSAQYQIGDKVKDFWLKGVDGRMHSIATDKGENATVIVFTCNHCPYAVLYEDRIISLQEKYKKQGVNLIAINPNDPEVVPADSYENMIVRAKEKLFSFPYLIDEGQKIYPTYGASHTPEVYLLDNKNVLRYMGAIDDSARDEDAVETTYLANAIDHLLAGEKINPTRTKAIGCSIKTK